MPGFWQGGRRAAAMGTKVLITGGAGFIGSHLGDELLRHGYQVRVLDVLDAQVHGDGNARPAYLAREIEFMAGDIRDAPALQRALAGVEAVVHLAARVGVGQSMYHVADYVGVNDLGTAVLLQALVERPVQRLIVASSMSIYGEGLYRDQHGRTVEDAVRRPAALRRGRWDPTDLRERPLVPVPTPEWKRPALASVYALSKFAQERLCLLIGDAYGIPTTALRFFNVYGARQALSNPYTGVLAIFAARLLNRRRPLVFEDGEQRRDFVDVRDVARACRLALEAPDAGGHAVNVGSGRSQSVREVGERLAEALGCPQLLPEITGRFRIGDVRHCFADLALARALLGYEPRIAFEDGVLALAEWLASTEGAVDRVDEATAELHARGLVA
jgi:dTDP-L-rhamnose 4-epimerase